MKSAIAADSVKYLGSLTMSAGMQDAVHYALAATEDTGFAESGLNGPAFTPRTVAVLRANLIRAKAIAAHFGCDIVGAIPKRRADIIEAAQWAAALMQGWGVERGFDAYHDAPLAVQEYASGATLKGKPTAELVAASRATDVGAVSAYLDDAGFWQYAPEGRGAVGREVRTVFVGF